MALLRVYDDTKGPGKCRSCGAAITWFEMIPSGRKMPFDGDPVYVKTVQVDGRLVGEIDSTIFPVSFQRLSGGPTMAKKKVAQCARCGRDFQSYFQHRKWTRYCSLACGRTSRRALVALRCVVCGEEILRRPYHVVMSTVRGPFCGFDCYGEWQRLNTLGSASPSWRGVNYVRIAEEALGKPLPKGAEVHHVRRRSDNSALVICQDHRYHMFLHQRKKAFEACGHADWLKCKYCGEYSAPSRLATDHAACQSRLRLFRRLVAAKVSEALATCPDSKDWRKK